MEKINYTYFGWRRVLFELYFSTMPIHKWIIRRNARKIYFEIVKNEKLSSDQILNLQIEKLNVLLFNSYKNVPYYSKKLEPFFLKYEKLENLNQLDEIPLLSKNDVRENLSELISKKYNLEDLHKIVTSGSTGEPFTTYADKTQLEFRFATTLRALEWTGWRFGDKQVRLWHQTIGMTRSQVIRERIDAFLMRRIFIPAFEISQKNIDDFATKIEKFRPVLIDGYAESLNFLASYLNSGKGLNFSPVAVMSSAQALPLSTRKTIETGLKTRVYDKYGSREFSGIAYQCSDSDDHHVMADSYIVELLVNGRPARPGEIGEIVITDLNNHAFPLIRYRIGDLAVAVDNETLCGCGRSYPRIGEISGRTQAIVYCANGVWMPGTFFAHFFKDYEDLIKLFQIHQKVQGEFTLKIIKGPNWSEVKYKKMIDRLKKFVGNETTIHFEEVDKIPLLKTGKRSPVVSEVRIDFQQLN